MRALLRLEKLEATAACDVPCAWHALGAVLPTPAGAIVDEGACMECGGVMLYNSAGTTARERELCLEVYAPGATFETLTASRRAWAISLWLSRRGNAITAGPGEVYKQALMDEHTRRMNQRWAEYLAGASDEALEKMEEVGGLSDAELEAIIWPAGEGKADKADT